jgi:predicted branched-subunit amino acid permease
MSAQYSDFTHYPSFRSEMVRGATACVPVLVGVLPFGLLLGAQAAQKGFSVVSLSLMTGLNFVVVQSLQPLLSGPLRRTC